MNPEEVQSQTQNNNIAPESKMIPRPPFNQVVLKRSIVPFLSIFITTNLLVLVLVIGVYVLLGTLLGFGFIFYPILFVLLIFSLLLYVFVNYAYYMSYISTRYNLIPGYIHQMGEAVTDQIPGKLEATYGGLFSKSSTVLRIDEYDRTGVTQSPIARMYNYGNIHLQQIDELQETKDYILTNVVSPYEATKIIQTMIDVEVNPAQTMQPMQ